MQIESLQIIDINSVEQFLQLKDKMVQRQNNVCHSFTDQQSYKTYLESEQYFHLVLENENLKIKILSFGATLTDFILKKENSLNIVLGYENRETYILNNQPRLGVICGRFANRIAKGEFELNEKKYFLKQNNFPNGQGCHLHGGEYGFDKRNWNLISYNQNFVELEYLSFDSEEGYPGDLTVKVKYTLFEDYLQIQYEASTTQTTIINLTNHSYFNLNGRKNNNSFNPENDIYNHLLKLYCSNFVEINQGSIPTGNIITVHENPPFNFLDFQNLQNQITQNSHQQIVCGNGFDHTFVIDQNKILKKENQENQKNQEINQNQTKFPNICAEVFNPLNSILLQTFTTEPGVQFYTGNFLSNKRSGFCLETQHFPDSPNQPLFPSTVLQPGQKFQSQTVYKVQKQNK